MLCSLLTADGSWRLGAERLEDVPELGPGALGYRGSANLPATAAAAAQDQLIASSSRYVCTASGDPGFSLGAELGSGGGVAAIQ